MAENSRRLVDLVVDLWNRGDAEIATRAYVASAERTDPYRPAPDRGPQQIANYVREVRTGFPDFRVEAKQTVSEGDQLILLWRCTGTHKAEFQGIPATGKRFDIHGASLFRLSGGQIREERAFFDRLEMLEQLGVSPGASRPAAQ